MVDTAGEPMRVALAPWLDIDVAPLQRFEALLVPSVTQALAPLDVAPDLKTRVGLVLGLPAPRPGLPADLEPSMHAALLRAFPNRFAALATFPTGHASAFIGMKAAVLKIEQGGFDACVVAGVESYFTPDTLEWLESNDQLHGAGPLNNAWGFIPGEAAGTVLLMSQRAAERTAAEFFGSVIGIGTAVEPNRIKTQTVCRGEGLTAAFRQALAALPSGTMVTDVYCDMNGEPYRADEFGFACLRTKEAFESASDFIAPADCWGDVSAASAPLGIMLSAIAGRKSYAKGSLAFIWGSSEGGERGASVLHLPKYDRE